ncbi:zinc finger CCCH domain-containing protein 3-like isoform X2 [Salvelinus alpinus]|uniref:zinc finger CCCH domain-containing protein 3-like isoform X2 n=1 Tax=Salvelinus alpinus TaxID=8036 RepID=UPI0039FD6351
MMTMCASDVNMERDALKRQIDLLQSLINNHKSVHGDVPSTSGRQWHPARPPPRGRGHSSSFTPTFPSRGGPYPPQSAGHWRKTYSLNNKTSSAQQSRPTIQTAKHSLEQPLVCAEPNSSTGLLSLNARGTSQPRHSNKDLARGDKDGTKCAMSGDLKGPGPRGQQCALTGGVRRTGTGTGSGSTAIESETESGRGRTGPGGDAWLGLSGLTGPGPPDDQQRETKHEFQPTTEGKDMGLPVKATALGENNTELTSVPVSDKSTVTTTMVQSTAQLYIRPRHSERTSTGGKHTVKATTGNLILSDTNPPLLLPPPLSASPSALQGPQLSPMSNCTPAQPQTTSSPQRHSKFTWVNSHQPGGAGPSQARTEAQPPDKLITSAPIPVCQPGLPSRRASAPIKKVPRKLSLSIAVPKTTKYTWVSSSASGQARLSRKPLSPKALALPQRAPEKGEGEAKKPKSPSLLAKQRKAAGASTSLSSLYRWKAGSGGGGQTGTGGGIGARRGSVFRWTSEKENGAKGVSSVPLSITQRIIVPPSSPGGFKLRSRMKIIRRSASSESGSERRSSPADMTLNSRYSLRRRTHSPVRTHTPVWSPGGVKRTLSRELVSFGRHKLRRLSPSPSRTGPAFPTLRSQAFQRVFRTRYKIETRLGGDNAHTANYSHTLSWRAKRIQTARSVLQSRLRPPGQDRHLPAQHWRGRGRSMRWIGGTLYSVSANKLSRTMTTIAPINRTMRWSNPQEISPTTSSTFFRPSSTRFVASRAVQRSLAIIRHARQKKTQKQYCMYFNRFGKCNRGNTCPYIHDPDKVAVCTRFLRGTCKQTDGTCPFSHKVAKEKCKKKHTLVCPDFSSTGSCPQGAHCKLQHRQRAKRTTPNARAATGPSATPAKKARTKRTSLSVVLPQAQAAEGSAQADPSTPSSSGRHNTKLPSFISLSSSPEDADAPDTPPVDRLEVTERTLQLMPRLQNYRS